MLEYECIIFETIGKLKGVRNDLGMVVGVKNHCREKLVNCSAEIHYSQQRRVRKKKKKNKQTFGVEAKELMILQPSASSESQQRESLLGKVLSNRTICVKRYIECLSIALEAKINHECLLFLFPVYFWLWSFFSDIAYLQAFHILNMVC